MQATSSPRGPAKLGSFVLRVPIVVGVYAALLVLYVVVLHPWLMVWSATASEQASLMRLFAALDGRRLQVPTVAIFAAALIVSSIPGGRAHPSGGCDESGTTPGHLCGSAQT